MRVDLLLASKTASEMFIIIFKEQYKLNKKELTQRQH